MTATIAKAKSWFCLLTKPDREIEARLELVNTGLDVYLPLKPFSFRQVSRSGKRKRAKTVMVAAKERHLFVSFGRNALNIAKLNAVQEIVAIFCTDDNIPISFGAGVIDAWQENERLGLFLTGNFYANDASMLFIELKVLEAAKTT